MTRFDLKKGDDKPDFEATLTDENGDAVNLTGASARFLVRSNLALIIDAGMDIVTPLEGTVKYEWQAGDTDTTGVFKGEVEVTYAGGEIQTFPTRGHFTVVIGGDLDD